MAIFGTEHTAALAVVAALGWLVVRAPAPPSLGRCLALLLAAAEIADPIVLYGRGELTWARSLPLELCDLAALAAIVALWTRHQAWFEFAWFWGLSGTLQALLTPSLGEGFPSPDYFRFFLMHGAIVCGALLLFGQGMRLRPGAALRVYVWTAVYTALLTGFNFAIGANYMFLKSKPPGSILEPFGPWPWYVFAGAGIAAVIFAVLARVAKGRAPA